MSILENFLKALNTICYMLIITSLTNIHLLYFSSEQTVPQFVTVLQIIKASIHKG